MSAERDITDRLHDYCVGMPFARIPWPHCILHEAHAEITKLRAERDAWRKAAAQILNFLEDIEHVG